MSSSYPAAISPSTLRSDLHSFPCQDEPRAPLVISVLASLLERTIARNDQKLRIRSSDAPQKVMMMRTTSFHSERVLDMSIQSFLERVYRYTRAAPSVYVVAYVYIDRICQFNPADLQISSENVHRLLIVSIMVASKFVEDLNYKNSYFARVGGLATSEMNGLEVDFLFLMGFKLHVSVSVFESYCTHLEREVSIGGGYQIERTLRFMCCGKINSQEIWEERGS